MIFWDTSGIFPLLVEEESTEAREQSLLADSEMVIWYGTPTEIESAMSRREREGVLPRDVRMLADKRLEALANFWMEVSPTPQVRLRAIRLLRVHALRAADAFQLAAALILCRDNPGELAFLTADSRLKEAAHREGFRTI